MRIALFLFIPLIVFAQEQTKVDSLNIIIENTNLTETKLEAYKEILYIESSSNLENLLFNIEKIKELHENESCATCLGVALYWEGLYYYLKGDLKKGIPIFETATKVAFEAGDPHTSNRSLTLLSGIYFGLNDYAKSEKYANQLISNGEAQNDITDALIDGYFMKGLINDDQSYYSLAIANYNKADSLNTVKKGVNFHSYQGKLYNNLSIVFIQIKDFEKAASYLEKTEMNYKKNDNKESLYSVKQNFGYLEVERENFEKAIKILSETNSFYKEMEMKHREGESNYLLGRAYFGLNKYNTAIEHLDKSLKAFLNAGDTLNAGLSHKYIGDSYLGLNNFKNSEKNYKQALAIFNTRNAHRNQINTLKSYSSLLEKNKNYKFALNINKKNDSIKSLFQRKQNEKQVFELDTKYQTEKKEQEITLLTAQNNLAQEQKANQRNLFIAGITLTSLAALFFFFQYRNRQKTNKKLRELDVAKSTFFTNISHDFRTPLTLIKGPIEDQLEDDSIPLIKRRNLNAAYKNTERLEHLVSQLMSLAKLNSSAMPLQVQPLTTSTLLQLYTEGFRYQSEEQGLEFSLKIDEEKTHNTTWLDQDILEKILYNLLGNALKYTSENGIIEVEGSTNKGVFQLKVYNSAKTISEVEKELLFKRFYKGDSGKEGTGIGLSLIKQLVTLHKGTITVDNEKEGIVFTVKIPTSKTAYEAHEILNESLHTQISKSVKGYEDDTSLLEVNNDAPVLLIVDDTKDIRAYIQSIFQDTYTVLKAANGQEGYDLAKQHIPDMIISDIVMPVMDGYTLTQQIKEDLITAHIPIILLTAKNKDVDELEAKGLGADIYMTKPFSPKLLKANVENLIENRRKLQQRFTQELILTPKEIAVTTAEEEFLNRLQEVLEEHLTKPDFTTAKFSEEMRMSRMQLHRKLKALTGLSSSEFIKNQRLKIAANMIKSKDLNISEVGYSIGFNDPSYFAKCFKQEYGVSPKEFVQKNKQ